MRWRKLGLLYTPDGGVQPVPAAGAPASPNAILRLW